MNSVFCLFDKEENMKFINVYASEKAAREGAYNYLHPLYSDEDWENFIESFGYSDAENFKAKFLENNDVAFSFDMVIKKKEVIA